MAHSRARSEWVNCKWLSTQSQRYNSSLYIKQAVWYDNSSLGHVDWRLWRNIFLASTEGDLD